MTDYSIPMIDSAGRRAELFINGDTIAELMMDGLTESAAREEVESNAFANAIADGLIGPDACVAGTR